MRRASILLLAVLFASTAAGVQGVGSVPVDTEKTVSGLEASFAITLVNPANTSRTVNLSAEPPEHVTVTFDQDRLVLPSSRTASPSGTGWVHLGDGTYAEQVAVPFTVSIDRDAEADTFRIPVTVTTLPAAGNRSGVEARTALAQDHVYTLTSTSPLLEPDRDQYGFDGLWRAVTGSDERAGDGGDQEAERNVSAGPDTSQRNLTGRTADPDRTGGTGPVTLVLLAGIAVSLAVATRELLR